MLHENVHRKYVASKVAEFVGSSQLESLKSDLKDQDDWRLSGSGEWTSINVRVTQTGKDRFSVAIEY